MSLGRGLGALIASTARHKSIGGSSVRSPDGQGMAGKDAQEKIWQIPVGAIVANPHQPRKEFGKEPLEDLAASIKEHGILQPLLVTEKPDGGYELVAGERRLRAAKIAGLATVPTLIKKIADKHKLEIALIENLQREDLNPIEAAFAFSRLREEFGLSHEEISKRVGKSRPVISNSIRLLSLPEEVKEALTQKRISYTQARALVSLPSAQRQLEVLATMMGQKITSSALEREVRKETKNTLHRDPNLSFIEDELRDALGTRVRVTKKSGRGTIVIEYFSEEEFAKIIKKITKG